MAKKTKHPNIRSVKGQSGYISEDKRLRSEGFVPYSGFSMPCVKHDLGGPDLTWGDYISSQLRSGTREDGQKSRRSIPTLYFSSGNEVKGAEVKDIGTQDLGYMEWGAGNNLPNVVALLTQMLPYTAAGVKFNADMLAGLGPQPMYDITQYVGGNITTKTIRYKDAGRYLKGKISDKLRELTNLGREDPANSLLDQLTEENYDSVAELRRSIKEEIDGLKSDYEEWERTNTELQDFTDRNNLAHTWLSLAVDETMFGICFPELTLNQQEIDRDGKPVATSMWKPKVIGINHRTCHTTRLERMDSNGTINYVYCSNRWLDRPFVGQSEISSPITALPALNPSAPLQGLQTAVRDARSSNVPVSQRPTRFVLPSSYPTAGRPYYPTPAWHSIFGGDIYEYLSTIISDRFNRKKNSNIIGRVIYLHHDYLKQLQMQNDQEGNKKTIDQTRDEFYAAINTWLGNRDNAGQSLLAFTFQGHDGKEHKSFEVVEIEAANKGTATANEKETAEISSVVFMALGLDARLLGSSPLSLVGGNSGTDIRERFLLRQILMSATQHTMLKVLEVASRFNGWDKHLIWDIKREVMTTLDRSKTGVVAAETNN